MMKLSDEMDRGMDEPRTYLWATPRTVRQAARSLKTDCAFPLEDALIARS